MMNTKAHGTIQSDDLRAIDWVPDGTIKLRPRTFTMVDAPMLAASPALFARKFDESIDADIFTFLENHIRPAARQADLPKRKAVVVPASFIAA